MNYEAIRELAQRVSDERERWGRRSNYADDAVIALLRATLDADPLQIVYVIRPGDMSEDVAAFVREEDAEAYRDTFDEMNVGDVERVTICGPQLAAEMIASRADEEMIASRADEDDETPEERAKERATCSHCLARTYRQERCICVDEHGNPMDRAEDYDEALADEQSKALSSADHEHCRERGSCWQNNYACPEGADLPESANDGRNWDTA